MIDTLLGGPPFINFHLSNILLFTAAASLLFLFLVRLGRSRTLSFILSLVFVCHPALTQTVAWIPGRNDSLLLIFTLLSFLSFVKFLESGAKAPFAGYLLFFLAAIFTNETAAVLPFLAAFYMARVFRGKVPPRAWLAVAAGSTAVLAVWLLARAASLPLAPIPGLAVILNIASNLPVLLVLLGKTVFPFDPGIWLTLAEANFGYGVAAAALAIAAIALSDGSGKSVLWFGLIWYLLFLLPTLIPSKGASQIVYIWEHRLCLPLAGFLLFFSELKWIKTLDLLRFRNMSASAIILLSFACISFLHSYNFSNPIYFWERAVEEAPGASAAQLYLGRAYYTAKFSAAAERQYKIALRLNPVEPIVHNNLGALYFDRGEIAQAEAEFIKELEINPGYPAALANLKMLRDPARTAPGPRAPRRKTP